MSTPRIDPAEAPFEASIAQAFSRITPPGREPLTLFRTMARSPRVLQRMFAGSLLDRGTIELRDREIVILRTCARCHSEYEWGVHVTFFAQQAGFDTEQIAATTQDGANNEVWDRREMLLIQLVDELHDTATVSNALWQQLAEHYAQEQLLELLALTGYYHTISFIANAIGIEPETYAARFKR